MLSSNLPKKKWCNHKRMKVYSFFRLLNKKIKQYEKMTSTASEGIKKPVTIIWVEDNVNTHPNPP